MFRKPMQLALVGAAIFGVSSLGGVANADPATTQQDKDNNHGMGTGVNGGAANGAGTGTPDDPNGVKKHHRSKHTHAASPTPPDDNTSGQ
jgi:hypothetical protein